MQESSAPHGADPSGGDARAEFIAFYRENFTLIVDMIVFTGGDWAEAEDATQHAMVDAFKSWSRIDHPKGWVRQAARRRFIKARENDRKHLNTVIKRGAFTPAVQVHPELTFWEGQQWVNGLLQELSPAQREVFECVMDGLTYAEVAEMLSKTNATVRKNHQLARDRLRARLGTLTLEDLRAHVTAPREVGNT